MQRIACAVLLAAVMVASGCVKTSILSIGESTKQISVTYNIHPDDSSPTTFSQDIDNKGDFTTEQDSEGSLPVSVQGLPGALSDAAIPLEVLQ